MKLVRFILLSFLLSGLLSTVQQAGATAIQMGVSVDEIPVGSDFNGTDIVVFGSVEGVSVDALNRGEYDVVIKVVGGNEDVVIRQKERTFGIWINNQSERFENVPAFYSVTAGKPLTEIAGKEILSRAGLGIDNLGSPLAAQEEFEFILEEGKFADALRRLRRNSGLYVEDPGGLVQLSPSLFRARVGLPPNVPIGTHEVTAYLFRDGNLLSSKTVTYRIGKVGFERWIYNLAHEQGLLYGIMAVLIAIFTGWAANAIFRKN
jgi:uncharacterized protein (TIGR02186 family)